MKTVIMGILILTLVPSLAQAQPSDYSKGHGYGYLGAGGRGDRKLDVHFGGGGEYFFNRHVGVGAEAGLVGEARGFGRHADLDGIGLFSPNLVARFRAKEDKTKAEPFVTAGYTRFFIGERGRHGVNFGGGVNWWFNEHVGLRFEVRDYIRPIASVGVTYHYGGAHIGLTFR